MSARNFHPIKNRWAHSIDTGGRKGGRNVEIPHGLEIHTCQTATCLHLWHHLFAGSKVLSHCNALQRTATRCNTLQRDATRCNALQCTATHCDALQHTATHCNTLQRIAMHCNVLQRTATTTPSRSPAVAVTIATAGDR